MLIERDAELAILERALKDAREGQGRIVLISGEAGLGKSSILSEFRRANRKLFPDVKWLFGSCEALFTPRTLGPLHDMAHDLGNEVTSALSGEAGQSALFSKVLEAIDTPAPAVMICEDLHWADHATLDLMKFLARRLSFLPVLLVLTFREDEVGLAHPLTQVLGDLPGRHTERIRLRPLTEAGVCELATSAGRECENIYEITGGNPFYVTELLAAQPEEGFVPASVKDAISLRLSKLSPEERDVLERISVLPNASRQGFLDAYLGAEAQPMVANCVARGMLVEDLNGVRFRHELARRATQERISPARLREFHAQCLTVLQDDQQRIPLDGIVYHASVAQDAPMVLEYAPQAARAAALAGAHSQAADHYQTALRFVNYAEPELAAELYEAWAYESVLADNVGDDVVEARRHAITLWRALNRPDKVGNNLRHLSRLHWYRGESSEATRYAEQTISVLEAIPPSSERAMAYSMRSQLHMLKDQMDEALTWAQQALELEKDFPDPEIRIHAFNNIGTAMAFRDNREGVEYLNESLHIALRDGYHEHAARAYNNLAEFAVEFREFELAEKILNEGLAFDAEHDLDAWTHYLSGRQALLRIEQGRLRDAEMIAEGIVRMDRLSLISILPAQLVLARARMRLGTEAAEALMQQALSNAIATDELQHIFPARLTLIEWYWLNDLPMRAAEHLAALSAYSGDDRHPWNIGVREVWAKRLGAPTSNTGLSALPKPFELELRGQPENAAQAWLELGLPYEAALVRLTAQNEESMSLALQAFVDMGAQTAVKHTLRLAERNGFESVLQNRRRGPYRAARSHPLGLTAKEQLVLKYLREGRSNREISEALNRSQRTVEHHVSSILSKMNAPNRMAAILRVEREPWLLEE